MQDPTKLHGHIIRNGQQRRKRKSSFSVPRFQSFKIVYYQAFS
jgi:hypothetical protein